MLREYNLVFSQHLDEVLKQQLCKLSVLEEHVGKNQYVLRRKFFHVINDVLSQLIVAWAVCLYILEVLKGREALQDGLKTAVGNQLYQYFKHLRVELCGKNVLEDAQLEHIGKHQRIWICGHVDEFMLKLLAEPRYRWL